MYQLPFMHFSIILGKDALISDYKKLFAVLDVNSLLWKRDFAALQVVYNIVVCRFFIIIAHSVVDTSCHIAVDGQRKQADDAVAPSRGGRIEGKNIVTLLCNVELEGLLLRRGEVVRSHIADVDVGSVSLTGNICATRATLDT